MRVVQTGRFRIWLNSPELDPRWWNIHDGKQGYAVATWEIIGRCRGGYEEGAKPRGWVEVEGHLDIADITADAPHAVITTDGG